VTRTRIARALSVLFLVLWTIACAGTPPAIVGDVAVVQPNESVPLARVLEFSTDQPAILEITVSDGRREWTVPAGSEPSTSHSVPIVGMRAATSHTASISLRGESGSSSGEAAAIVFETPALPTDYFPPIEVKLSDPARMEPGVTMFSVLGWGWDPPSANNDYGLLVAVDEHGEIIWYYQTDRLISDHRQTARGTILYQHNHGIVEIDVLGNVLAAWGANGLVDELPEGVAPIATDLIHHQIRELPSGNLLTLGTEVRRFESYPSDYQDPAARAPGNVVSGIVLEFDRDGTLAHEWKLIDILDPYRISYGSLAGYWSREGYDHVEGGTYDWGHSNGLVHDSRDDSLIISFRHQDTVVKISRQTGEIIWILGDPAGWGAEWQRYLLQPEGELTWPYHTHAPGLTATGNLILFDNGNYRAQPPGRRVQPANSYSRAVEFAIDEETMTVRQVWSYGGPGSEHFYSAFMGDADGLTVTGNVLITDGGNLLDADGVPSNAVVPSRKISRILEVTGGDGTEKVFEIVIDTGAPPGWSIFHADRLPGLQ
jgi:arylsulfate sulfotransferase